MAVSKRCWNEAWATPAPAGSGLLRRRRVVRRRRLLRRRGLRRGGAAAGLVAGLQGAQHLRRDVHRLVDVQHAVTEHEVEARRARVRLHFLQERALELAELLVTAQVQVLDILVLLARQLALAVALILFCLA